MRTLSSCGHPIKIFRMSFCEGNISEEKEFREAQGTLFDKVSLYLRDKGY